MNKLVSLNWLLCSAEKFGEIYITLMIEHVGRVNLELILTLWPMLTLWAHGVGKCSTPINLMPNVGWLNDVLDD